MNYTPKPPRPSPQRDQVRTCLAALRSLLAKRDKEIALGQIIAGLVHSSELTSAMQIMTETGHAMNYTR